MPDCVRAKALRVQLSARGVTLIELILVLAVILIAYLGYQWFSYRTERGRADAERIAAIEDAKRIMAGAGDPNINAQDASGRTVLMWAAANRQKELVRLSLALHADINRKDRSGKTALAYAASNNDVETGQFLIVKGANVNAPDNEGRTPLFHAATAGNVEMVRLLLKKGANRRHTDKKKRTALSYVDELQTRLKKCKELLEGKVTSQKKR